MGRREMEEMISGFWEYRSMKMAELQDQTHSVDSLLHEYLLSRNDGNEETAIEDGYNLQVNRAIIIVVMFCHCSYDLSTCSGLLQQVCALDPYQCFHGHTLGGD